MTPGRRHSVSRGRGRGTLVLSTIICALAATAPASDRARADERPDVLTSAPILRIETGRHTAAITRMGLDAGNTTVVTAGYDKTLRVWSLPDGRLRRTLRVPIDNGAEGYLYAGTVSPDGLTAVAAGWTTDGAGGWAVYAFDTSSGVMKARITGLAQRVVHLAYSKDGRLLAAMLRDGGGLRVFDAADFSPVAADRAYTHTAYWADFAPDGRLVTSSYDGRLRLYGPDFRRIAVAKASSARPFAAAFSPDGERIAVGYNDSTRVDLFSGRDLALVARLNTAGVDNGTLHRVGWSADGEFLYAGGHYRRNGFHRIRMWSKRALGPYRDLPVSRSGISQILAMRGGGFVFATLEPRWGVHDARGRQRLVRRPMGADLSDNRAGFAVSADGGEILFEIKAREGILARFSFRDRLLELAPSLGAGDFEPPRESAPGLAVTDWRDSETPKLNGRPIALDKFELGRGLAFEAGANGFVLGTSRMLRRYGADGALTWAVRTPGDNVAITLSRDGRVAVAAYADGTFRWHRMSDGKEVLGLFPHRDARRWVAWTRSGYFMASAGGDRLFGWHVNNGRDKAADFFPAARLRATYYRPDVVLKVLETLDEAAALAALGASGASNGAGGSAAADVRALLPPVVRIIEPRDEAVASDAMQIFEFEVRAPSGEPITAVHVLADGRPMATFRQRRDVGPEGTVVFIEVAVPQRDTEISVIAENRRAASVPARVSLKWRGDRGAASRPKPNLRILAIGVSEYADKRLALSFPAKDAGDFARALGAQQGVAYGSVEARVLTDGAATKQAILDGLDWIERATGADDVAMIFLAGHGVDAKGAGYHYLPHDAVVGDPTRRGVPYSALRGMLSRLKGRTVFFLDTCHAGFSFGRPGKAPMDVNRLVNDLSSSERGVVVFASSTGEQYSAESARWNNGAFTRALVEGLTGAADVLGRGYITIAMLDLYVSERVRDLTGGLQTPTTGKPLTVADFHLVESRAAWQRQPR